jgi:hypothetical protein
MLTLPERRPGRTLVAVGLVFALAYAASLILLPKPDGRVVIGDAVHYYVYLRSAVFDGDLAFRNDYVRMYRLEGGEPDTEWVYQPTATGHTRNLMSVGPALLWLPLYLGAAGFLWMGHWFGLAPPPDGFERVLQASTGFTGIAAATLGAWLAFVAARHLFGQRAAIWSTLMVWLASSAVYYSVISPTYSHAASMLACSALVAAWVVTLGRQTPARYLAIGLLGGIATLMRWQDAIYLLLPPLEAFWLAAAPGSQNGRPAARRWMEALTFSTVAAAGAVLAFVPQMVAWTILYGSPLLVPQGESFMRWGDPSLWAVLFSTYRGLVTWTPVVGLSLVGLALVPARHRLAGTGLLAVVVISWYVNAAVSDWWAGEAFGARRFVSCVPIFVIGLSALVHRLNWSVRALALSAALIIGHTFLFLVQYQAFMKGLRHLAPYPDTPAALWLARFAVPWRLLEHFLGW